MKEYMSVIAAIIAGVFAIASAFIAWRLKRLSDTDREKNDRIQSKREEIKSLYVNTFKLFEEAMRQVANKKVFTLAEQFSENNARIHLLSPEAIIKKYSEVADILERWSILYEKANPKQIEIGDQVITMIQSPNPTKQYEEPAKAEYEKLQMALQQLVELMRDELRADA